MLIWGITVCQVGVYLADNVILPPSAFHASIYQNKGQTRQNLPGRDKAMSLV
jgi:hypothetical protein